MAMSALLVICHPAATPSACQSSPFVHQLLSAIDHQNILELHRHDHHRSCLLFRRIKLSSLRSRLRRALPTIPSGPSVAPWRLSDIPTRLDRGLNDVHVGMAWLTVTLRLSVTFHAVSVVIVGILKSPPTSNPPSDSSSALASDMGQLGQILHCTTTQIT